MGLLTGKNILMIIPVDYYNEDELEIPHKIFMARTSWKSRIKFSRMKELTSSSPRAK